MSKLGFELELKRDNIEIFNPIIDTTARVPRVARESAHPINHN